MEDLWLLPAVADYGSLAHTHARTLNDVTRRTHSSRPARFPILLGDEFSPLKSSYWIFFIYISFLSSVLFWERNKSTTVPAFSTPFFLPFTSFHTFPLIFLLYLFLLSHKFPWCSHLPPSFVICFSVTSFSDFLPLSSLLENLYFRHNFLRVPSDPHPFLLSIYLPLACLPAPSPSISPL